jgi:hypothetical protein
MEGALATQSGARNRQKGLVRGLHYQSCQGRTRIREDLPNKLELCGNEMVKRLWNRLPVTVRAIIIGELVVSIGGLPPPLAIIANLRTTPRVPWIIVATALWLSLFWWYLRGGGWPRQSAESRKRDLGGNSLPARVWVWALLAGTFGIASSLALGFATLRVAGVTREAFASPIKLSNYPMLTCDVRHCVD